jgi:hypothetical protein
VPRQADLPGKTAATLELKGVVPADGGDYRVVAKTGGQTLTSAASSFAVVSSAPILSQSPGSAVRFVNGSVSFSTQSTTRIFKGALAMPKDYFVNAARPTSA